MLICTPEELFASRPFEPGLNRGEMPERWAALGYTHGAEIGVQSGINARTILERWPGHLLLVDIWAEGEGECSPFRACERAMAAFPGRTRMIKLPSVEAAAQCEPDSLDCLYIDAAHTYENVKADLEAWYPIVKPGGMIGGHDFGVREGDDHNTPNPERLGVAEAVMEFADRIGVKIHLARDMGKWANWFFTK